MSLFIDFHAVQSVPPANINRDEDGSPKTTTFCGTRRARVSSQAWKRAIRRNFRDHLDESELGIRTLRMVDQIAPRISNFNPSITKEASQERATEALSAAGIKVETVKPRKGDEGHGEYSKTGALLFLSNPQIDALARLAAEAEGAITKKGAKGVLASGNSIDLALFGRMIAEAPDINVDAAAQVAHAIGTHTVVPEFDYFTAVDDKQDADNAGAGMIGTVEFNTATLYRYATVNLSLLQKNLGDVEATARAVEAFTRSFVTSMPTGKQNTFANKTLPNFVLATVRTDQPINLAAAFEDAIEPTKGLTHKSVEALVAEASQVYSAFDAPPAAAYAISARDVDGLGEDTVRVSLGSLVSALGDEVRNRLGANK